jgi:hypothetical protein
MTTCVVLNKMASGGAHDNSPPNKNPDATNMGK